MSFKSSIFNFVAIALVLLTGVVKAQDAYPSRPIRMLIPLAAGSAVDVVARIVADKMADKLGQPIVVENQPGASGLIATGTGARAEPDGYTILAVNDSILTMLPHMYARVPYDALKDFAPITQLVRINWALVAHPSLGVNTVEELIALAKSKKGAIDYASGGQGSPQHVAMEMFKAAAHIDLQHIPYKGATPALNDVVAGHVPVMFTAFPTPIAFMQSKQLRILATASEKRLAITPDVPTIAEKSVPGFTFKAWGALIAPAATPRPIIMKLHDAAVTALADPQVREKLLALAYEIEGNTPEEFAKGLKEDYVKRGETIRAAGIKIE